MASPPAEPQWTSIIPSVIAVLSLFLNVVVLWRNRGRMEFRVVTSKVYCDRYTEEEIRSVSDPEHGRLVVVRPGDCRSVFVVLEIAIENRNSYDTTVGQFLVDDWMFSKKYMKSMYDRSRDYRVFDLYTRQDTSLDKMTKLEKGQCLGLRIEVFERGWGPRYEPKHPGSVDVPKDYRVEFYANDARRRHRIRLAPPIESGTTGYALVNRWSDLLGPMGPTSTGEPLPTGIEPVDRWRTSRQVRIKDWTRSLFRRQK